MLSRQVSHSILVASSIGHTAYTRLKIGEEGTVQEVFDKAINVLFLEASSAWFQILFKGVL